MNPHPILSEARRWPARSIRTALACTALILASTFARAQEVGELDRPAEQERPQEEAAKASETVPAELPAEAGLAVDEVERVCRLTPEQSEKVRKLALDLAGPPPEKADDAKAANRLVARHVVRGIGHRRAKPIRPPEADGDRMKLMELSEAVPVTFSAQPAWTEALEELLTDEQLAAYDTARTERREYRRDALVDRCIAVIHGALSLTDEQQPAIHQILSERIRIADNVHVESLADDQFKTLLTPLAIANFLMPDHAAASVLDPAQLATWKRLTEELFDQIEKKAKVEGGELLIEQEDDALSLLWAPVEQPAESSLEDVAPKAELGPLDLELDRLEKICDLTDDQHRKLRILGKSIVVSFDDSGPSNGSSGTWYGVDSQETLENLWKQGTAFVELTSGEFWQKPLLQDTPKWKSLFRRLLTPDQKGLYDEAMTRRTELDHGPQARHLVSRLDRRLLLDASQRTALAEAIEEQLGRRSNDHVELLASTTMLSMAQVVEDRLLIPLFFIVPNRDAERLFSEAQLACWNEVRSKAFQQHFGQFLAKARGAFVIEHIGSTLKVYFDTTESPENEQR
ncbi:MAG: hypothetical protein RL885_04945 [Planctomycetota bacterium]